MKSPIQMSLSFPAEVQPVHPGWYLVTVLPRKEQGPKWGGWTDHLLGNESGNYAKAAMRHWNGKAWRWRFGGQWRSADISDCTWQGLAAPQI